MKIEFFSIDHIWNEIEPLFLCSQSNTEHTYSRNVQVDWETSWRGRGSLGNFFLINFFLSFVYLICIIFKHLPCFGSKQLTYWQIICHILERIIAHFDLQCFSCSWLTLLYRPKGLYTCHKKQIDAPKLLISAMWNHLNWQICLSYEHFKATWPHHLSSEFTRCKMMVWFIHGHCMLYPKQ